MNHLPNHKRALLVTKDPMVEAAVRQEALASGDEVEIVRNSRDAMSLLIGGCGDEDFAIVDLETEPSGRRLLETAGGALPVVAITNRVRPWLASMLRRCRVGAALTKPFSLQDLQAACHRVRRLRTRVGRSWK